jgi:hypothetical protein
MEGGEYSLQIFLRLCKTFRNFNEDYKRGSVKVQLVHGGLQPSGKIIAPSFKKAGMRKKNRIVQIFFYKF